MRALVRLRLVLLGLLLFLVGCAEPRGAVGGVHHLTDTSQSVSVASGAELLPDPDGRLDFQTVRDASGWTLAPPTPHLDFRWGAAWLRVRIRNQSDADRWLLWQPHPMPERFDAYVVRAGEDPVHHARRRSELSPRFPFRGINVELDLPPETETTLYLRYSGQLQAATAELTADPAFADAYSRGQLYHGIWYGLLLALLAYNLILFVVLRDAAYGYYIGWVGITGFFFFARNGHIGELEATRGLAMALASKWMLTTALVHGFGTVVTAGFCRRLLDTASTAPRLDRVLYWIAWSPLLGVTVVLLTDGRYGDSIAGIAQLAALAAALTTGVVLARRGSRLAMFYLVAWGPLILATGLYILRYFGFLPYNDWTEFLPQVGIALEATLLSLTLSYRIRLLQRDKEAAVLEASRARADRDTALAQARADGFARLLEATDRERRRIARDIHDSLGQLLLSAKALLDRGEDKRERARELLQEGIEEARNLSHGIYPDRLDLVGLRAALAGVVDDLPERSGLVVDAEIRDVDQMLSPEAEVHVFRIAQEAIKNAYVHGAQNSLYVSAEVDEDDLVLVVVNDGTSLPADAGGGLGLTSIRERAAACGGTVTIEPLAEGGTQLELRVPIQADAAPRSGASAAGVSEGDAGYRT